jgi:hypothetical protein
LLDFAGMGQKATMPAFRIKPSALTLLLYDLFVLEVAVTCILQDGLRARELAI